MGEHDELEGNGWDKWQIHVLKELKRLATTIEEQNQYTATHRTLCDKRFGSLEIMSALNKQSIGWFVAGMAFVVSMITTAVSGFVYNIFKG